MKTSEIVDLLTEGRLTIIEDVLTVLKENLPTYDDFSDERHRDVVNSVYAALLHVMRGADLSLVEGMVIERGLEVNRNPAYSLAEWVVRTHVYFPATRRYLVTRLGPEAGIAAFEEIERRGLKVLFALTLKAFPS